MSAQKFQNPVVRWIDHRLPVFSMLDHEKYDYPVPKNLNYMWNFGVLAGLSLAIMIITGIVLAMSYTAHVDHAFDAVERILEIIGNFLFNEANLIALRAELESISASIPSS